MTWIRPNCQNDLPCTWGLTLGCRAAHSCDKVGKFLYVFGGWDGKVALNDLAVLNIDTMEWTQPETMGLTPCNRNNHTTAVVGTRIYVHGGHDGTQWLDDLYVLNTETLTWHSPAMSGTLPSARACHTLSRVGGKLYMFGGYDGEHCFNSIEILDIDTMTWIKPAILGTIPLARNAHTMTVIEKRLYLFGGHSGNKHLTDLHIFDTLTLSWSEVGTSGTPPKGLRGHTANLIGSKIFIFGGYDGRGRSKDCYYLETLSLRWSHLSESEDSPSGRQRHSACVIRNKQMLIFGGFDGNKWLNDMYILNVGVLELKEHEQLCMQSTMKNMKKLINDPTFSDITLVVEGKPLYLHKAILATQCEHFKKMFSIGMKESKQNEIEIKSWPFNTYLTMVEYLYTGIVENFDAKVAMELIGLADAYTLEELKNLCEKVLQQSLDDENVGEMLILAYNYSAYELKKSALKFLLKSHSELDLAKIIENLEGYPLLLAEVAKSLIPAKSSNKEI